MRIVSLLPSLTELVCALGRGDNLAGVTHECDYPPGVEKLPHLTRSRIPSAATSALINELVAREAGSLYELDERLLEELNPDVVLTQEQCDVCAVNEATVRRAAGRLAKKARVESVNPTTLSGVFAMFRRVGSLLAADEQARALVARFDATAGEISRRSSSAAGFGPAPSRPRVLFLEWLDPPFSSGHWIPDIIDLAGGVDALGRSGKESRCVSWDVAGSTRPDVILVAPCGFTLDRTIGEIDAVSRRIEWRNLRAANGRVVLVDGSAYFSRPGPRLETSLRIAAAAIDPEHCGDLAPPEGVGWCRLPVAP
jgi:iron complex transport system substrate-binding protein